MRIIYISHWRFPSEKTMSPLIMKTCEMFARKGIAVELWIPWRQNRGFSHLDPFEHHGIERNFRIRRLPSLDFTAILPGSFFFFLMLAMFQIALFFYVLKSDFLRRKSDFGASIFYFHDVRDAVIPSFFRKPMFLEIHDFYKSGAGWINRRVFTRLTGFIVTNRFKLEALKKYFGIPEEKMLHQPNAVDIKMFAIDTSREAARRILGVPTDKKVILYTGHLFYWKGTDTLLEAAHFLGDDELVYFVGGTDEDVEKFKVQSSKFKNVIIAGRRPHKEIPLWLRSADVLVLPSPAKYPESKYETSPVKLFEYMASGTPVVASDVPSIRNVADERLVFFFEPDNSESLAKAVQNVFKSYRESEMKATAAREEAEKYSWEKRRDAIVSFIDRRMSSR